MSAAIAAAVFPTTLPPACSREPIRRPCPRFITINISSSHYPLRPCRFRGVAARTACGAVRGALKASDQPRRPVATALRHRYSLRVPANQSAGCRDWRCTRCFKLLARRVRLPRARPHRTRAPVHRVDPGLPQRGALNDLRSCLRPALGRPFSFPPRARDALTWPRGAQPGRKVAVACETPGTRLYPNFCNPRAGGFPTVPRNHPRPHRPLRHPGRASTTAERGDRRPPRGHARTARTHLSEPARDEWHRIAGTLHEMGVLTLGRPRRARRLLPGLRPLGGGRGEAEGHADAAEDALGLRPAEPLALGRQQAARADGPLHGRTRHHPRLAQPGAGDGRAVAPRPHRPGSSG